MDTFGIIFGIIIVLAIIFGLKPLIKARKKAELEDIEKFNKFRLSSNAPDRELSRSLVIWLAMLIALIELTTILGIIFIFASNEILRNMINSGIFALLLFCLIIFWIINLWLKRCSYEKGKWLNKYSYKRIYFFLPVLGGIFLLQLKTE